MRHLFRFRFPASLLLISSPSFNFISLNHALTHSNLFHDLCLQFTRYYYVLLFLLLPMLISKVSQKFMDHLPCLHHKVLATTTDVAFRFSTEEETGLRFFELPYFGS